jgi:hypothetical protein
LFDPVAAGRPARELVRSEDEFDLLASALPMDRNATTHTCRLLKSARHRRRSRGSHVPELLKVPLLDFGGGSAFILVPCNSHIRDVTSEIIHAR